MAALVSVEAAVFRPDFLEAMVRSVLEQTFPDFEVNLMVDGGGGRVEAVLDRFSGDRRLHVHTQPNAGTAVALRNLAGKSDSRYMTRIDEDDCMAPGAIETMVARAEGSPGFALVRSAMSFVTDDDRRSGFVYTPQRRSQVRGMTDNLFDVSQLYLFPRELYERVGGWVGDPGHDNTGEDSDLFARLEEVGPFLTVDEILYEKRIHDRNLARTLSRDRTRSDHIRWLVGRVIERRRLDLEYLGPKPVRTESPFPFLDLAYRTGDGEEITLRTIYPTPSKTRWRREVERLERKRKGWWLFK